MSNIRRVYFYLVTLITLGIFAAGIRTLLFLLFDLIVSSASPVRSANFFQQQLSLGLAMLVIGGPLWFFFWRRIQFHVDKNELEIGSAIRKLFLSLILVVTSLMALFAASDVLKWLMAGLPRETQFAVPAGSLATLIVTAAIWFYYLRVSEIEGHPSSVARTLRRWYVYIVSGWGLVWLTVGVVQLVYAGTLRLPVWGQALVEGQFWGSEVRTNISWIVLGGLWWAFHWLHMAKGDIDSVLRQVYVYLLAIVGSSVAGLVALVITLYNTFVWALGDANGGSDYFNFLGWTIPTIVVTAGVWVYHRTLAQEEALLSASRGRLSSRRIHFYIMSFIGLGTMIAGLVVLLGILIDLIINGISPPVAIQPDWWREQLGLCFALLLVAVPLWWYYWNQLINLADRGGVAEWRARSRRIYLYVIIGAAIIALAADLVNIVYRLLNGLLTDSFGVNVLRSTKWSIQSLIVAVPLLIYHWRIAREDQRRGAEAIAVRKDVSVLAGIQAQNLISRLEDKLGGKMRVLQYSGPETETPALSNEEIEKLTAEIESSPAGRVMVVIHAGKVLVLPYHEKG